MVEANRFLRTMVMPVDACVENFKDACRMVCVSPLGE